MANLPGVDELMQQLQDQQRAEYEQAARRKATGVGGPGMGNVPNVKTGAPKFPTQTIPTYQNAARTGGVFTKGLSPALANTAKSVGRGALGAATNFTKAASGGPIGVGALGLSMVPAATQTGEDIGDWLRAKIIGDDFTSENPYKRQFAAESRGEETPEMFSQFGDPLPVGDSMAGQPATPGAQAKSALAGPGGYGDKKQYAGAPLPPELQAGQVDPSAPMQVPIGDANVPATDDSAQAMVLAGQEPAGGGWTYPEVEQQVLEGATMPAPQEAIDSDSQATLQALGKNAVERMPTPKNTIGRRINQWLAASSGDWNWNRLKDQEMESWLKQNAISDREKVGGETARENVEGAKRFNRAGKLAEYSTGGMSPQMAQLYSMITQDYLGGQNFGRQSALEEQRGENAVRTAEARQPDLEAQTRAKNPLLFPKQFPDMDPVARSAFLQGKAGGGPDAKMQQVLQFLRESRGGGAGSVAPGTGPIKVVK